MTKVSTREGTGVLSTFNFRGARRQASEAPDSPYPPSVSNLEATLMSTSSIEKKWTMSFSRLNGYQIHRCKPECWASNGCLRCVLMKTEWLRGLESLRPNMEEPRWGKHPKRVDRCVQGSLLCPWSSSLTGSSLCDILMRKQSLSSLPASGSHPIDLALHSVQTLLLPHCLPILSTQAQAMGFAGIYVLRKEWYLQTQRDTGTNSTRKTGEQEAKKLRAIPGYIKQSRPAWVPWDPVSKQQK